MQTFIHKILQSKIVATLQDIIFVYEWKYQKVIINKLSHKLNAFCSLILIKSCLMFTIRHQPNEMMVAQCTNWVASCNGSTMEVDCNAR